MKKLLFVFLFFFLCSFSVKAENVEVVKRPSGIVSTKTVRGKRIETELQYIYINGEIAYCIEPGVALGSSYIESEDFLSVGIGKTLKKELELITYYGYAYEGHASPYYYAATQEYIWEKMGATDISFTQNGQVLDIKPYKVEILRLFLKHETLPSFASNKYEMQVSDTLELKDTNGVLEHFTSKSEGAYIKGNTLFVSSEKEENRILSFIQKRRQGKSLVYFSGSNQNVATFTLDDVYTKKFTITVDSKMKKGRVVIQKVDQESGEALEGAEFNLYNDDGIVGKGKTDARGFLVFENLVYGKYRLEEKTAPRGYIREDGIKEVLLDKEKVVITRKNAKHNMPVTSNIDVGYRNIFSIFSSLGLILFYVSKKVF